jgi:hypothetical protein
VINGRVTGPKVRARGPWVMRREGRGIMSREGGEVMRRGGRRVMGHEGSGSRDRMRWEHRATRFGEAAAPRALRGGWTALSGVLVTRPGPEWAAAGACWPRVKGAGWSHVTHGPGSVKGKPYVMCGRECYRNDVAWR